MAQHDILGQLMSMMRGPRSGGGDYAAQELARQDQARREHTQFVRSLTTSYVDLWNNAATGAEKDVYGKMLEGLVGDLGAEDRKVVEPLLKGTPLSVQERKRKIFLQEHGERPTMGELTLDESPVLYGERLFQQKLYDSQKALYMTGVQKPVPRVVGLDGDRAAVRGSDGRVTVMSGEQLQGQNTASIYGMPFGQWVAQDGKVYGDWEQFEQDGRMLERRTVKDTVLGRDLDPEVRPTEAQMSRDAVERRFQITRQDSAAEAGAKFDRATVKMQQELAVQFSNKKGDFWELFKKQVVDEGEMTPEAFVRAYIQPHYPGHVVMIKGLKKDRIGTDYTPQDGFRIMTRPGVLKRDPRKPNDPKASMIFDPKSGRFFDSDTFAEIPQEQIVQAIKGLSQQISSQEYHQFGRIRQKPWSQMSLKERAMKLQTDMAILGGGLKEFGVTALEFANFLLLGMPQTAEADRQARELRAYQKVWWDSPVTEPIEQGVEAGFERQRRLHDQRNRSTGYMNYKMVVP